MAWHGYLLLLGAGFAAGFINTLAGSGSLLTLPALLLLGLPAPLANGTNRVAILMQNVVAVATFAGRGVLALRRGLLLAVPAAAGGIVGARLAVGLEEALLRRAIGIAMLAISVLLALRPRRWLEGRRGSAPLWVTGSALFGAGVYGGFVQAGVGIFLIVALVGGAGLDLLRANAVKVLIVLCFTVPALAIFARHGQVDWVLGGILGLGNMAGAWVAAHLAVRRGAPFLRWVLLVVALAAGVWLAAGG